MSKQGGTGNFCVFQNSCSVVPLTSHYPKMCQNVEAKKYGKLENVVAPCIEAKGRGTDVQAA